MRIAVVDTAIPELSSESDGGSKLLSVPASSDDALSEHSDISSDSASKVCTEDSSEPPVDGSSGISVVDTAIPELKRYPHI